MKYLCTTLCVSIHLDTDNPVFGESATHISIDDEAGGPFIVLAQDNEANEEKELRFDAEELEHVCQVAKDLIAAYPHKADV